MSTLLMSAEELTDLVATRFSDDGGIDSSFRATIAAILEAKCWRCEGRGQISSVLQDCSRCDGTGKLIGAVLAAKEA